MISHPQAVEFFNKGCQALQAGATPDAVAHFRKSLVFEPGALETLYQLGCSLRDNGELASAIAVFLRCSTKYPDHADTAFNLACCFEAAGDVAAAILVYRKCLHHNPDDLGTAHNLAGCLRRTGDLAGAIAVYRAILVRHPDYADGLFNLACCLQGAGDVAGAIATYRDCLARHPTHAQSRFNLAASLVAAGDRAGAIAAYRVCIDDHPEIPDSFINVANLLMEDGEHDDAIAVIEEACRYFPNDDRFTWDLAFSKWKRRIARAVARDAGLAHRRILLACMPKSGSTYLADVLAKLPSMHRVHLVPGYGRREQEISLEQIINHQHVDFVAQLHIRPSETTLDLCQAFAMRPVFLFRNVWDVMASLRDHMHNNSLDWSMARIDPEFRAWDEARQYDFLARTMMPWFIDFYVSWSLTPDKLAVSYERMMADPVSVVADIARWSGIPATEAEIVQALAGVGKAATFNKGGSGRGSSVPASARAQIEALASYYPQVDFAPLLGR